MKNKLKKLILIILLIFSLSTTLLVKADSGWDSSYDSGGSYSSSSSSSSWSSSSSSSFSSDSSSHSHSSGNYSGNGKFSIDGIIFLLIFFAVMFSPLYIKTPKKKVKENNYKEIDEEELKKYNLDKEEIKKITYNLYKDIQNAWTDMDYDKLRKCLTDEIYNSYTMQLDTLKTKKQKNIMSDFKYIDAKIIDLKYENGLLNIKVYLNVKMYDYVIDKDKKVVRGNKNKRIDIEYVITIVKSANNVSNNICPNCGANIESNASGKCEYCGSVIVTNSNEFVMSSKTCVGQRFE